MKKQRKSSHNPAKVNVPTHDAKARSSAKLSVSRRDMLQRLTTGTVAVGLLGLGGWGISRTYAQQSELLQLSDIGNGIPTIVQVHDPQCPTCRTLQKRTLRAVRAFDDTAIQVRVANISEPEGRAIATLYGVSHVTLLLFDGQGHMQSILTGLQEVDYLRDQFRAHLARFPA